MTQAAATAEAITARHSTMTMRCGQERRSTTLRRVGGVRWSTGDIGTSDTLRSVVVPAPTAMPAAARGAAPLVVQVRGVPTGGCHTGVE